MFGPLKVLTLARGRSLEKKNHYIFSREKLSVHDFHEINLIFSMAKRGPVIY